MSDFRSYPPFSGYSGTGGGGGGGGAPVNASYLVLGLDATLTDERVFTPAARFAVTDGGAGGNYDLDLAVTGVGAGAYAYPSSVTVDVYGRVTAITAGSAPVASGWTDGGATVYLTTDTDVVSIGNAAALATRKVSVYNTGANLGFRVQGTASGENVLDAQVAADANPRFGIDVSGVHGWGPATTAYDVALRRLSAGALALDNNASGTAFFVPRTDATCGVGSSSLRFADMVANTHRVFAAAGAANPTASLSATALQFGPGGGVALDTRIQRVGTSSLTFDNNAGGAGLFSFLGRTITQARTVGFVTTAASPYAVATTDDVVLANPGANQQVNLPNAAGAGIAGRRITIKRVNTSAFTVTVGTGGGNIDGAATNVLAAGTYNAITVVSDGANWWII